MSGLFRLTLLPYLQSWESGTGAMRLNVIAYPVGDPRLSLTDGLGVAGPAIADASLVLRANLSSNVAQLPLASTVDAATDIALVMPPNRHTVFDAMYAVYAPSQPELPPANTATATVSKYLTQSYRGAFPFIRPKTPLAVVDDSYHRMLTCPPAGPVTVPPQRDLSWAEVFANVLRAPQIMRDAGLLHTVDLTAPDPSFFQHGGWISFTLSPTSDYADAAGLPGFVRSYATRVPALTAMETRPLFTAVLFPLFPDATAASAAAAGYDTVFPEAITFDDGFAKIVHVAQPKGMDHLDEEGAGPAPVTDHGIQLGWDDEDILIGQNRQLGLDPDGTTPADAPRGVGGYRVDVRHPGAAAWTSLSTVHRDHVMLGTYNAGTFDGELRTEVHPRTIYGKMWLPAYFTSWTGGSMVVDTYADKVLRGVPNPTRALYDPVSPYAVQLRYGRRYEFRVRMTDASGGAPAVTDSPYREGESPFGGTPFLRYLPPKKLLVTDQQTSANGISLSVARPLIDYPAAIYAGIPNAVDELLAIHDANVAAYAADPTAVPKEVGLPDPDVAYVEIRVMVRPPAFDREGVEDGWREVYMTRRTFPTDPAASLTLIADYVDVAHLGDLDLSGQAGANATGPVVVPTARDVRLELRALTRDDPTYFGTERARRSKRISIDLHGTASVENGLFRQLDLPRTLASVFLRNDPLADGAAQTGIHPQNDPAPVLLARLASAVGLVITDEDTLCGPQGQRVVFGCTGLKHRLSPESATLTLTHIPELANVWVNVFRAEINRDWSWKGTDSPAATLRRQLQLQPTGIPTTEDLGTVELPHSVNAIATSGDIDRERIVLIYLDAFSAPVDNGRPYEIAIQYDLSVRLEDSQHVTTSAQTLLPVTTPPKQMPQVVSAGHALSEYVADEAYSATAPRARSLWLEMAAPLADRRDAYFVRVLAHSPDPMLLARAEPAADPVGEAKSPLDPELVRVIVPGQSDDFAGLATMQKLIPAAGSDRHFLVPLPPDTTVGSPELFGFYSYEVRVGHDAGNATEPFWSTAQGRFGPRLTIEGVQHPAPGLTCVATRLNGAVLAAAPYAQPFYQSANVLPDPPNTEIWMALYVQVHQADRASMRNILIDLRQARVPDKRQPVPARPRERFAEARWDDASLAALVGQLGLDHDAPLSVLAIEILPEPNGGFRDPLGGDLGDVRVLRTSPLAPIATVCC